MCVVARLKLRHMVKLAKYEYYHNIIDKFDYTTMFNIVRWAFSKRQYTTSPIKQLSKA